MQVYFFEASCVPARGSAIAPLVKCDNIEACLGQRGHDLPPRIGQLRETMEKENERVAFRSSLDYMVREVGRAARYLAFP